MKKYLVLLFAMVAVAAVQAVTFESHGPFDIYHYDVGEIQGGYTNVQAWTPTQLSDLYAAIDEWDRVILDTPARQIQLHVGWLDLGGEALATSVNIGTNNGTQTLFTGGELAWREGDASAPDWDAFFLFDVDAAGSSWNFGQGAPSGSSYDFRSVITHQIGHSLGWSSSYSVDTDTFGQIYGGGLTAYDGLLVDSNGNKPLSGGLGTPGDFNVQGNPVFFDGPNATNLYGGLVPIYAPDPYTDDSNLLHLDEATFTSEVMTPEIGVGEVQRTVSDLEIAMMSDMGWDVIPEPASLMMMVVSAVGFIGVRRVFRM